MSIAIARGHDVRKAINAAQMLGQRSSSSEMPTADLSASAACHQLLLPSDATDVSEVLELLSKTVKNSVKHSIVCTSLPVERALRPWTNVRLQL